MIQDEKFNIKEQIQKFVDNGWKTFACWTCLKIRNQAETQTCPLSTMQDLLNIIEESDKIVSF